VPSEAHVILVGLQDPLGVDTSRVVAAPTRHNGYEFVAIQVKDSAVRTSPVRDEIVGDARRVFGTDAVIIGASSRQTYGDQRAVNMLRNIDPARLPWAEYEIG
jgi:hypothetical protein